MTANDNYIKVPTEWTEAPPGIAMMPHINVLLGTKQIEVRSVYSKLEWRRKPQHDHVS